MSRFNTSTKGKSKTTNLAGGTAYKQSPEMALVSILLTSFLQDKFYKSANQEMSDLTKLLGAVDPEFAAKAAVYARNEFGMRSITHVLAGEMAKHASGKPWAKEFYAQVIRRPDDMTEIITYYFGKQKGKKKLSASMKKGFSKAFGKFDPYQLGKYRMEGKDVSLVDVANLVHPVPTKRNGTALKELIEGTLKSSGTFESELSAAGQGGGDVKAKKAEAWRNLVLERKIGYFALLKNLRNIIQDAPEVVDAACELLTDRKLIKNSLVMPFRFLTAIEEIEKLNSPAARKVLPAINNALDISCDNVPKFDGDTLVVLDTSGSMRGFPSTIGSIFSAILVKSNNADFMTFDNDARYQNLNIADSTLTMAKSINFNGGATNFPSVFQRAEKKYDRIIILSDMQGWQRGNLWGYSSPVEARSSYENKFKCKPHVYSFDLNGHSTTQFHESQLYCIAGWTDKVFDIMGLLEQDKKALVNEIKNKVTFDRS